MVDPEPWVSILQWLNFDGFVVHVEHFLLDITIFSKNPSCYVAGAHLFLSCFTTLPSSRIIISFLPIPTTSFGLSENRVVQNLSGSSSFSHQHAYLNDMLKVCEAPTKMVGSTWLDNILPCVYTVCKSL